jgi:cytochrome c oxidase subunit 2
MDRNFDLFPEQASTAAQRVDNLYFFLCALTAFFTLLIFVLIVYFALKYRRRDATPPAPVASSTALELFYTIVPFLITMVIFFWGAKVYFFQYRPPADALSISIIGKQWMWKMQHENGKREINALHVPRGQPVKLTLGSQDVIHSFFIPAFRIKMDAVPGRSTTTWFEATKTGEYHLFCTEYCGKDHSKMIGTVVVMEPHEYQAWLAGSVEDDPPAVSGAKIFTQFNCHTCHGQSAPTLSGLFGSKRRLADGSTILADEHYLRESIIDSTAKLAEGYPPLMPSFRGQISEEQLLHLIAYIKSLKDPIGGAK